jgi:RND family efflux transporter MFP subunit
MDDKKHYHISKKMKIKLLCLLVIMLFIAVFGIFYRIWESIKIKRLTEKQAITSVAIMTAKADRQNQEIVLPGNVVAWHETTIFARSNGYVINWLVDIGTYVKKGDLLAVLSAPEVNAQLKQTEANLKTAEANSALAESTKRRWVYLLKSDSVSKQETDEKVSDAKAKAAIVLSTRAARDRLRDLVSFQKIIAPFDGVIRSRTTDIGHLINAGSGTIPLFRLVQNDRLRVYIRVPEYYAKAIGNDFQAKLYFREHPGKSYTAKLLNTAKSIDPKTRTLLVQLEIDNSNHELFSGSYAEVHFNIPSSLNHVILPINTLIFNAQGLQVAIVNKTNQVEFKKIMMGRDFGDSVEVAAGITAGEKIILNPPDYLIASQKVAISNFNLTHREQFS